MSLALDRMSTDDAAVALSRCCGARRWVDGMLARRPFGDRAALLVAADEVWATMTAPDVLEAFSHHPEIGADIDALRRRFPATATLSAGEQAGVALAADEVLAALREANLRYRERFGYIFIVCATGKTAEQMLEIVRERTTNDPDTELRVAAAEQAAITRLRLEALA
jgi:2-oxo-4-hydroxy-4-carboxy-5-ureidoimidazoline decarboxylase